MLSSITSMFSMFPSKRAHISGEPATSQSMYKPFPQQKLSGQAMATGLIHSLKVDNVLKSIRPHAFFSYFCSLKARSSHRPQMPGQGLPPAWPRICPGAASRQTSMLPRTGNPEIHTTETKDKWQSPRYRKKKTKSRGNGSEAPMSPRYFPSLPCCSCYVSKA